MGESDHRTVHLDDTKILCTFKRSGCSRASICHTVSRPTTKRASVENRTPSETSDSATGVSGSVIRARIVGNP